MVVKDGKWLYEKGKSEWSTVKVYGFVYFLCSFIVYIDIIFCLRIIIIIIWDKGYLC